MNPNTALQEYFNQLKKRIAGDVRTDEYTRILYSTDASIYQIMPYGVVLPRSTEDVHAAVELAAEYQIPLLPRAGGSSLAGQAVNEAVVIDMTRHLDKLLEVNIEEKWVCVQPGIVLDILNQRLQSFGLQFGPDPASSNRAALGGIVGNNSTGAHSILYGMTADHVLETQVFLSDGCSAHFRAFHPEMLKQKQKQSGLEGRLYTEVHALTTAHAEMIRTATPRHWRRCGGYNLDRFVPGPSFKYPQQSGFNLAKLICGSEGTLAVMHEIKLNLVPRPTKTALAIVHFKSLYEALSATPVILETEPSAVELLDNFAITLCRKVPAYARLLQTFIQGNPNCLLITEFYGKSETELKSKVAALEAHLRRRGVRAELVPAFAPKRQQNVWDVRKVGLGLLMSIKGDYKPIPFIEDAAVPPEHLADYVLQIEKFCNDLGTKVAYYAHASAGCLHIRPFINAKIASEVEKLPRISRFAVELLGRYGGALSSEHGDGRARSWLNEQFFGKELYGLFKKTKRLFDPDNIFNPGIVVDAEDMRKHLRYGPGYSVIQIREKYDFSENEGFQRAVEMCNGAGICRKTTTGTMCPSFMATREEEHSTRGRANALRAAISGKLKPDELTSKRMFEVMDLCIECKACKAECPSSVDMAKIKFEFLAQYYEKKRVPLRTRLFAGSAKWSRLSSGTPAGFVNWMSSFRPARAMLDSFLGISKYRDLPELAKQPFPNWFQERDNSHRATGERQQVVLFSDTFNTYHEPQVLIAAVELLEAAGFELLLPPPTCCGRPMISKGLFHKAKAAAQNTVNTLKSYVQQGLPVIGLEPSCLFTLRDEVMSLLPGDESAKLVAKNSYMIEEFLMEYAKKGDLRIDFSETPRHILLHGHCFQKSLIGTEAVLKMLSLPNNYTVEEVDSGCCGMAGAFGYESEHYEISMQMGERRLLPAVRKQSPDTLIAASGFSCRHQIKHGTGKTALHPVEILQKAVRSLK
ncbi:MAG: FAD-binding and (Fe-S)-binding domain-containing protein [bacterium]